MDGQDNSQPTQATQAVLDPRRLGQQNSGFSDDDVSDIICILYPHSLAAKRDTHRLANENCPYIIGKHEADTVEVDYAAEDDASRFQSNLNSHGNYAIILRLSSPPKDPRFGFAFGRNVQRCDVVFGDPDRRISNIHFRIYVNEYGSVMIEDQSTNGTFVDRTLLSRHPNRHGEGIPKFLLSSGCSIRILLHNEDDDLVYRVRIPKRLDLYDQAYLNKVEDYIDRYDLRGFNRDTIRPNLEGHVDLFPRPPQHQQPQPTVTHQQTHRQAMIAAQNRTPRPRRVDHYSLVKKEWISSSRYNKVGIIGKGAFAVVYKVTAKYDGLPYAAKELEKRRFMKDGVVDGKVENEMRIMQKIKHPHVVQYIEHFDWEDRFFIIIMEYVPRGDLGKHIHENSPFSEDMAQVMSKQLLSALGYLHANRITHRDVKPDNILINSFEPLDVKLTDFGLSKMVDTEQTFLRTFCGTLLYCAPEVYNEYVEFDDSGHRNRGHRIRRPSGQRYSHAVDIWSLGGVIFYAMTGLPPYPVKNGISPTELLTMIMTLPLDVTPLQRCRISDAGIDFLSQMLQRRPEYRAKVVDLEDHSWLGGSNLASIPASQSYDEITDDEDLMLEASQDKMADLDIPSDSDGEYSDQENANGTPGHQGQQRLFGEIGVSAIGSSGAVPEDFLNLAAAAAHPSIAETEIMDSQSNGHQEPPGIKPNDSVAWDAAGSVLRTQSADQLQSLVENVASQSLGGRDRGVPSPLPPELSASSYDVNASKRKPPSPDLSADRDRENRPPQKPHIKRFKSDVALANPWHDGKAVEEMKLLAQMPAAKRVGSRRQVDGPVTKCSYWEEERSTWHLQYPEMTQLQYAAFLQAAKDTGQVFSANGSPLWQLAMKYFPPTRRSLSLGGAPTTTQSTVKGEVDTTMVDIPSTAPPVDVDMPDRPELDTQVLAPVYMSDEGIEPIGIVVSADGSCVPGITLPIMSSFLSFGRAHENTHIFKDSLDRKVPKYAFKMVLLRESANGPIKDSSRHPWMGSSSGGEDDSPVKPEEYSFWISTKASLGILVNGYQIPSWKAGEHGGASKYWARLHDGDSIQIWGGMKQEQQTLLRFNCSWGASATPRQAQGGGNAGHLPLPASPALRLQFAGPEQVKAINYACGRWERKFESKRKYHEADLDLQERVKNVAKERERSDAFEEKRLEAIAYLHARTQ